MPRDFGDHQTKITPESPTELIDSADLGAVTDLNVFELHRGDILGDYLIEQTLGRGAFGVVYRAIQRSLGRVVALKIVSSQGEAEGRRMAQLTHPNIVSVYSETVDVDRGIRLLAMQYVAGTTLEDLLNRVGPAASGRVWTEFLDALHLETAAADPAGNVHHDHVQTQDPVDCLCDVGEQLASALYHAHLRGVLHRDIKPANVLIDRYGRPLLADFNLAANSSSAATGQHYNDASTSPAGPTESEVLGGTLAYMAPEHLRAFLSPGRQSAASVNERSDLFSLAVLLWQLLTGNLPFPVPQKSSFLFSSPATPRAMVQRLLLDRDRPPEVPAAADRHLVKILRQALAPDPGLRPATARELEDQLAGLRQFRQSLRSSDGGSWIRWASQHPAIAFLVAGIVPQLIASGLQIVYNAIQIVSKFTPEDRELFFGQILIYNPIVYPACLAWMGVRIWRVMTPLANLRAEGDSSPELSEAVVVEARQRSLRLPGQVAMISAVGWFGSAIAFPVLMTIRGADLSSQTWWHFIISFGMAGSIAAAYGSFATHYVVLRAIYPHFWLDRRAYHVRGGVELQGLAKRLRQLTMIVATVPLIGATVLVLTGDDQVDPSYRILIAVLIGLGALGATWVGELTRQMTRQINLSSGMMV